MESSDGAGPFTWEEDRQGRRERRDGEKLHLCRDPGIGSGKGRSALDRPHNSAQQCPGRPTLTRWGIAAPTVTSPAPHQHFKTKSMNPTRLHKDQLGEWHLPPKEGWQSSPARLLPSAYPSKFLRKHKKRKAN